ncbi:uncharacterized protein Bfra_003706 [Botrytis fragariae]|uniref:Uncharacterized protein n=1 Tax=Botrytis fragariae TaxID=1964551 RepID=A0A8H6EK58_9HELO|nr:uncharacterized protein Bfra_003706 [Botrytis fragariae]KAF5875253.1 hypothetical protein Bfra_003706 [Botrytis fragariae]
MLAEEAKHFAIYPSFARRSLPPGLSKSLQAAYGKTRPHHRELAFDSNIDVFHFAELIDKDSIGISTIGTATGPDEAASSIFNHSQVFLSWAEAFEVGEEVVGLFDNLSIGLAAHTSRQDNCHKD